MSKVLVSGARSITDYEYFCKVAAAYLDTIQIDVVIHGGAKGVDQLVTQWCEESGTPQVKYKPYFTVDKATDFSPRHYFMRNKQMVEECDRAVIIDDGDDTGTKDLIARMKRARKPFVVVNYPKEDF